MLLSVYRNGTVRMVGRWNYRNIREMLNTPMGAQRALLRLYSFQTEGEQQGRRTQQVNARGFNQADAPYLTEIARKVIATGRNRNVDIDSVPVLPADVLAEVQERLMKYAAQLADYGNRADAAREKARREQDAQAAQRGEEYRSAQEMMDELAARAGQK
jgi:hypothetical protein